MVEVEQSPASVTALLSVSEVGSEVLRTNCYWNLEGVMLQVE